jgi:HAD superfamily hydrolase (TIGR01509 family)
MRIRALFYDFDGLILETEGPIYQSWRELYASYGVELPLSSFAHTIGVTENTFDLLGMLEERLGRRLPRQAIAPQRRARELELVSLQPVLPGVAEALRSARRLGLKQAVVSSSTRAWVGGHLERLGLRELFDGLVTREDVPQTKPHPDLYLAALRLLKATGDQAMAFEDSPSGVRAAKAAGIFCVAVPSELTRAMPLDGADLRIDSLAEKPLGDLLELIHRKSGGHPRKG